MLYDEVIDPRLKKRCLEINCRWHRITYKLLKKDKVRHLEVYSKLVWLISSYIQLKLGKREKDVPNDGKSMKRRKRKMSIVNYYKRNDMVPNKWANLMKRLIKKYPSIGLKRNFTRFLRYKNSKNIEEVKKRFRPAKSKLNQCHSYSMINLT